MLPSYLPPPPCFPPLLIFTPPQGFQHFFVTGPEPPGLLAVDFMRFPKGSLQQHPGSLEALLPSEGRLLQGMGMEASSCSVCTVLVTQGVAGGKEEWGRSFK